MSVDPSLATRLISRANAGDAQASRELLELLYVELRRLAGELMRSEREAHTLQPTALVHEAWMRLCAGATPVTFQDRAHFVRTAAQVMRRVLVDHARARGSERRTPPGEAEPLDALLLGFESDNRLDLLALDEALARLEEFDERAARVVELRFFGGLTSEETATAIGASTPTVERSWRVARLWLARELGAGAADGD
jgi:RNA polymerase sigma factor (TIGR02999 family)